MGIDLGESIGVIDVLETYDTFYDIYALGAGW